MNPESRSSPLWRVGMLIIGGFALLLGLVGLLILILPGILFLVVAVICFAEGSRRIRARLHRSARISPYLTRWERSRGLGALARIKLGFWLMAGAAGNTFGRTSSVTPPHG